MRQSRFSRQGGRKKPSIEQDVVDNGDDVNDFIGGTANVINNGSFLGLEKEDQTFNPTGNAANRNRPGFRTRTASASAACALYACS